MILCHWKIFSECEVRTDVKLHVLMRQLSLMCSWLTTWYSYSFNVWGVWKSRNIVLLKEYVSIFCGSYVSVPMQVNVMKNDEGKVNNSAFLSSFIGSLVYIANTNTNLLSEEKSSAWMMEQEDRSQENTRKTFSVKLNSLNCSPNFTHPSFPSKPRK